MIQEAHFDAFPVDKAFDADWRRAELNRRGATAAVPPKVNRTQEIADDEDMYGWRHSIENYGRSDTSYGANLNLAATVVALRQLSTDPRQWVCFSGSECSGSV